MKKLKYVFAPLLLFAVFTAIITSVKLYAYASPNSGKTLIIDAGHGGLDGGAVSPDGLVESTVNLDIAKRMECICALLGIKTLMTRSTEDLEYPESAGSISAKKTWDQKQRVEFINGVENAVLISIHQNMYPDSRPKGSQVLYSAAEASEEFGKQAHEMLIEALCPENRRVAAPVSESIFLMRSVSCPAILVECGFLSNRDECALLRSSNYKTRIALVLTSAYMLSFG